MKTRDSVMSSTNYSSVITTNSGRNAGCWRERQYGLFMYQK